MEKDIEILEELLNRYEQLDYRFGNMLSCKQTNALKHLIQAYKEQQPELKKKDKIIDKMSDMLVRVHSEDKKVEFIANINIEEKKAQIKQYFERKVEDVR